LKDKVVVLNSGGFDSVVLLHHLKLNNPELDVHTLFFNYGQNSVAQERSKALKVCHKLGLHFKELVIPRLSWSSNDFYKDSYEVRSQYLEFRNLIFLSFALSFAEGIGAGKIYMAVLKSHFGYKDTSPQFCADFSTLASNSSSITLETPFILCDKEDLIQLGYVYGVEIGSYHSCDVPVDGKPCGKCLDCESLSGVEDYYSQNTPAKVWGKTFDPFNPQFEKLIKDSSIVEARLLINNSCQLNCTHCFYGFEEQVSPDLSVPEMNNVINECVKDLGVKNFHFSGKEPLYDDKIFSYTDHISANHPGVTFDVVTNGVNVPMFASRLKKAGFSKVALSIDDLIVYDGLRKVDDITEKALESLNAEGIPVEIFIDLHKNNYRAIGQIIDYLLSYYSVDTFLIRTIVPEGKAKEIEPLTLDELSEVLTIVRDSKYSNNNIVLSLGIEYTYRILNSNRPELSLFNAVCDVIDFANTQLEDWLVLFPKMYCGRFESQVTITSDGYVLGCGSDVCYQNYNEIAEGNFLNNSLAYLVEKGKETNLRVNQVFTSDLKTCPNLNE
jgi:7-cyano-7-deazaguanine synthase